MRVLFVRHGQFPGYAAPEAKEWARHARRAGVDVEFAVVGCLTPGHPADGFDFPVHVIDPSSALRAYRALRPLVRRADIVHYILGKGLEFLPLLSRHPRYVFSHISVSVTGRPVRDRIVNLGKRLQPFFADHVTFTDQSLRDALEPVRRVAVSLLPVGYPDDLFFPCPPRRSESVKRLLYHGAVRTMRRLEVLVEVLGRLPANYHLTILGGDSPRDEAYGQQLVALAGRLGCDSRFEITKMPQGDVRSVIDRAYLCLSYVPVLECYQEQFVIKTLESLACHRPVLATATRYSARFRDAIGPERVALTDGTVDNMVAKILEADPFVTRFYAPANLSTLVNDLKPYTFRHIVQTALLPVYRQMLGSRTAAA